MTAPRIRGAAPATTTQQLIGPAEQVRAALSTAHRAGVLVAAGRLRRLPDGRLTCQVRLRVRPEQRIRRPHIIAAVAVTAVMVLAGVVWAVAWAVAHLAVILAAALLIGLLAAALRRTGVCCPGLHCPGCGHK